MLVCKLICTYQYRQVKQTHKRCVIKKKYWWQEGVDLKSGAPGAAEKSFVTWKWVTVLRRGDQYDKGRRAERTQRELESRKGKVLNRTWGQSALQVLKRKGRWRGEREDVTIVTKTRKAPLLVRLGQTRKWGEMRLHGSNERKRWTCLFSSFCSQSVADKSLSLNSVSHSWLREPQGYEGKRIPSDTCDPEE